MEREQAVREEGAAGDGFGALGPFVERGLTEERPQAERALRHVPVVYGAREEAPSFAALARVEPVASAITMPARKFGISGLVAK